MTGDKSGWAALGGMGAALAAGVCCIGAPLATAGLVSAAGVTYAIEPLRPVFLVLAVGFFALAFRLARRRRSHCEGPQARSNPAASHEPTGSPRGPVARSR